MKGVFFGGGEEFYIRLLEYKHQNKKISIIIASALHEDPCEQNGDTEDEACMCSNTIHFLLPFSSPLPSLYVQHT